jgi:hypothetical protein
VAATSPTLVGGSDAASAGSSTHLWFAGAAGVAAIAAGAGALWWRKSQQEVNECRSMEAAMLRDCTNEADLSTRRNVAIGTTIGLGVTALTTGVLAAILWRSDDSAPAATTSTVACFGGNNSVSCAFRF